MVAAPAFGGVHQCYGRDPTIRQPLREARIETVGRNSLSNAVSSFGFTIRIYREDFVLANVGWKLM